jgi:hypothetical protein
MDTLPDDRRCTATSKQSGERCKRRVKRGAKVCKIHGGGTEAAKKAAEVRAARIDAERQAQRMVARAGVDADPIEHLVDCLHRASALVQVWGAMVAELDDAAEKDAAERETRGELGYTEDTAERSPYELHVFSRDRLLALDRYGQAGVHPFVTEYQNAIDRQAKYAKLCIDAGVAERQVELYEQQVEVAYKGFEAALAAIDLTDEQKQKARKAYAAALRS